MGWGDLGGWEEPLGSHSLVAKEEVRHIKKLLTINRVVYVYTHIYIFAQLIQSLY